MKFFLLSVLMILSQATLATTGLKFNCKKFELGEKDQIKINVDLEDVSCTSTTPFPCVRTEGIMTISNGNFQDKLKVLYAPDYQRFYLYAFPDEQSRSEREGRNTYILRSDDRLVEQGSAPGTLEVTFPNTPFSKKLVYALTCQRR